MKKAILNNKNQQKKETTEEEFARIHYFRQKEEEDFNKFLGKAAPNKANDEFAKKTEAQLNSLQK